MKKIMLATMGVMLGAGWGWSGPQTLEGAAAGSGALLNSAAAKLSGVAVGANLLRPQASGARDLGYLNPIRIKGNATAPLPQASRLDAEQMQKLAAVAAAVYSLEGRRSRLSHWSNPHCVPAGDMKLSGSISDARHCIVVRGKVHGDKTFELQSAEMSLDIYGTGTEYFFGRPTGDVRLLAAEFSVSLDGDGSVGRPSWTFPYGGNNSVPDAESMAQHEVDFWLSYKN